MSAKWIVYVPGKERDFTYEFATKEEAELVCDSLERLGFEPTVCLFSW